MDAPTEWTYGDQLDWTSLESLRFKPIDMLFLCLQESLKEKYYMLGANPVYNWNPLNSCYNEIVLLYGYIKNRYSNYSNILLVDEDVDGFNIGPFEGPYAFPNTSTWTLATLAGYMGLDETVTALDTYFNLILTKFGPTSSEIFKFLYDLLAAYRYQAGSSGGVFGSSGKYCTGNGYIGPFNPSYPSESPQGYYDIAYSRFLNGWDDNPGYTCSSYASPGLGGSSMTWLCSGRMDDDLVNINYVVSDVNGSLTTPDNYIYRASISQSIVTTYNPNINYDFYIYSEGQEAGNKITPHDFDVAGIGGNRLLKKTTKNISDMTWNPATSRYEATGSPAPLSGYSYAQRALDLTVGAERYFGEEINVSGDVEYWSCTIRPQFKFQNW